MKKSLLVGFAIYLGVLYGYYAFIHRYIEFPGDIILSFLGSLFLFIGWGALCNIIQGSKDVAAVKDAIAHKPLKDGELTAAIGTIRAIGTPLVSPLTRKECVAYDCEISREVRSNSSNTSNSTDKRFTGFALTPSIVRSPRGDVRLLALVLMDEFEKVSSYDFEAARTYVSNAKFENMSGMKVFSVVSKMKEIFNDDDGSIRFDWKMTSEPLDVDIDELYERVVPEGAQVCALGVYSAVKQGLVSKTAKTFSPIRLIPGDGPTVLKTLSSSNTFSVLIGLALFLLMHAFLGFALWASVHNR